MKILGYEVHEMTGFSGTSKEKYMRSLDKLMNSINSEEFKHRVKNYSFMEGGQIVNNFKSPEVSGKYMTREEIYEYIMSGRDKFNDEEDGDIDIKIELYNNRFSSAVGYTYPNTWKTWINLKFFGYFSDAEVAANIIHEYMHNLGFDHPFRETPTRRHTVPYAIGNIIKDILEGKEDTQDNYVLVCSRSWTKLWLGKTCHWVKK
jgi:hypothetical protein